MRATARVRNRSPPAMRRIGVEAGDGGAEAAGEGGKVIVSHDKMPSATGTTEATEKGLTVGGRGSLPAGKSRLIVNDAHPRLNAPHGMTTPPDSMPRTASVRGWTM
jgi:hypothetical protein